MINQIDDLFKVSVIIPCYKCSKTILRAVNSVLSQTLKPLEIILIDDFSDDDTLKTLYEIYKNTNEFLSIKIVSLKENKGVAFARNEGWNLAAGNYIAFLDADDSWHPQKLELQRIAFIHNPSAFGCGTLHKVTDSPHISKFINNAQIIEISFKKLIWRNYFTPSSVMVKNSNKFRFMPERRYMEDHLLWLVTSYTGNTWLRIESFLTNHHRQEFSGGGLSGNLWAMECAELFNYYLIYKKHAAIGVLLFFSLIIISFAKYLRRVGIVVLRKALSRI